MSILTKEDRKDLVYASRKALLEQVRVDGVLTESKKASAENFILNEASYEQLLNLVYNPDRDTNYMKTEALELVAMKAYEAHIAPVQESVLGIIEEANIKKGLAAIGKKVTSIGKKVTPSKTKVTKVAKVKAKAKDIAKATKDKASKVKGSNVATGAAIATTGVATGYLAARRANKNK